MGAGAEVEHHTAPRRRSTPALCSLRPQHVEQLRPLHVRQHEVHTVPLHILEGVVEPDAVGVVDILRGGGVDNRRNSTIPAGISPRAQ